MIIIQCVSRPWQTICLGVFHILVKGHCGLFRKKLHFLKIPFICNSKKKPKIQICMDLTTKIRSLTINIHDLMRKVIFLVVI